MKINEVRFLSGVAAALRGLMVAMLICSASSYGMHLLSIETSILLHLGLIVLTVTIFVGVFYYRGYYSIKGQIKILKETIRARQKNEETRRKSANALIADADQMKSTTDKLIELLSREYNEKV